MRDNVVELYPDRPPLGQYIRVGTTGHVQLETLLESGRLPIERAVIDGAMISTQASLIKALGERGRELVLETNIAELSSLGRFGSVARKSAWAVDGRPLTLTDFEGRDGDDRLFKIASCAVDNCFHTVLSPSHVLSSASDPALTSTDAPASDCGRFSIQSAVTASPSTTNCSSQTTSCAMTPNARS